MTRNPADLRLNLTPVRLLEIVGKAANRLPGEERVLLPEMPSPQASRQREEGTQEIVEGYGGELSHHGWQHILCDNVIYRLGPHIVPSRENHHHIKARKHDNILPP
jgi:hypothetical protein